MAEADSTMEGRWRMLPEMSSTAARDIKDETSLP
jgi:hypothetical protein